MTLLGKLFRKKDSFEDLERDLATPPQKRSFPFDEQSSSDFSSSLGVSRTRVSNERGDRLGNEDFGPSPLSHPFRESSLSTPPPSSFRDSRDQDMELILKNLELLSSKIDSLKASLESMNQRVQTIERIALREQER